LAYQLCKLYPWNHFGDLLDRNYLRGGIIGSSSGRASVLVKPEGVQEFL
jgi:hypothetical protein